MYAASRPPAAYAEESSMQFDKKINSQPIPSHAKRVFQGVIFEVYQWEQELYDGSIDIFEKLKRQDTVGVIAVKDRKIIMSRQEQPGTKPFYGLLGGRIDEGETPEASAVRELREEGGMVASSLAPWLAVCPSEKIDWTVYTLIAKGCTDAGPPELEAGERIELMEVEFEEFVKLSRHAEFRDREVSYALMEAELNGRLDEVKELILG